MSKGTYIRSIARDLGLGLGTRAHLCGLVRTSAGDVGLDDCVGLEELTEQGAALVAEHMLDPVVALGLPSRALDISEIADISCGRRIAMGSVRDGESEREPKPCEKVALVWDGALAGIWQRRGTDLVCDVNFPQAIEGVR